MPQLDVARLEALGFFRYTRPEAVDELRREPSLDPALEAETRRAYHADAENLAEGDVRHFLGRVAPFLRRQGVPIEVVYCEVRVPARNGQPASRAAAKLTADGWLDEDGPDPYVQSMRVSLAPGAEPGEVTEATPDDRGAYVLSIGDREIVIWGGGDPRDEGVDDWSLASRATVAILDELLTAHGSAERAYAKDYGNDLTVVFATPEMAAVLNAAADTPRERLHDGAGDEKP